MNILITAATELELRPFVKQLEQTSERIDHAQFRLDTGKTVKILTTGVGIHRTVYHLTRALCRQRPDICFNCGIAGAFGKQLAIGQVVEVVRDCFSELGALNAEGEFLNLRDMGLEEDIDSYDGLMNPSPLPLPGLAKVRGITVNTVHGKEEQIALTARTYGPDIETMEGAAFFYVCLKEQVPFHAIRAISNVVEPRDIERWDIETAIGNLSKTMLAILRKV